MTNELPDIMHYTTEYILGTDGTEPLTYLGKKQVLSLLGPHPNTVGLVEALPPAMELTQGDSKVPIYLWRDVYALLVKVGLHKQNKLITN